MINTPTYPIYSYPVTIESPFTVNVTLGATTFPTATILAGEYYGFVTDGTEVGSSVHATYDSSYASLHSALAQAIVDCLADPAKHNLTSPTLTLTYRWATAPEPRLIVDYTRSGVGFVSTNVTITFPSVALANLFGHSTTTDLAWNTLTQLASTDFNFGGYWFNRDNAVLEERWASQEAYAVESMYGGSHATTQWGDAKLNCITMHPTVYATMVFPFRRTDVKFSGPFNVDVSDPYNLLETFIQTLSDGREFLMYCDNDLVDSAWIGETSVFDDIRNVTNDVSTARVFEVTIPMRIKERDVSVVGTNIYVG